MPEDFSLEGRLPSPVFHVDGKILRAVRSLVGFYCEEGFEHQTLAILGYFGFSNPVIENQAEIVAGSLFVAPGIVYGESPIRGGRYSRIGDEELIRLEANTFHLRDSNGKLIDATLAYDLKREGKTDVYKGTWSLDTSAILDREPPRGLVKCKIQSFVF